jgi:ribonuclease HI
MVAIEFHRVRPGRAARSGASARKQARKEAARAIAKEAIRSLLPQTLVAFTDGSANPNPGPSGAGAFLYSTSPGDSCHLEATAALGEGTNNLGEIWAIGMAAQMALDHISSSDHNTYTHFQLFTDSMWARSCVLGEWKSVKYGPLVEAVALALQRLSAFVIVNVDWVPAHVGIDSNEHADFLAGRGTLLSQAGRVNVNTAEDYKTGAFVPSGALV